MNKAYKYKAMKTKTILDKREAKAQLSVVSF